MGIYNACVHQYDSRYADAYEEFYLHPWQRKHNSNLNYIRSLLRACDAGRPEWLDLFCGQAWHFAQFPQATTGRRIGKTGVDRSAAQLARARARNPDARFLKADVLKVELPQAGFDLVTCFWAAYCYLGAEEPIRRFLERAIAWTRPGGAIYLELLFPADLETFNASPFSQRTGFRVLELCRRTGRWVYADCGGRHEMASPPFAFFADIAAPRFARLEADHDGGFMTHFRAVGKRPEEPARSVCQGTPAPGVTLA